MSRTIEIHVRNKRTAVMNNIFDPNEFGVRIAVQGNNKIDKSFIRGVIQGIKEARFGEQVIQAMGKKGTYKFIKHYEKSGNQHLIFRLYADNKVNYHDYELVKSGDKVKAADIFIYLTGENLSETLARALVKMDEMGNKLSRDEDFKADDLKKIKKLMNEKKFEEAKAYFDKMPSGIKKEKLFLFINMQICAQLNDSLYLESMENYSKLYPQEPNTFLLMIDYYALKDDYRNVLEYINRLDSLIDKDPFLDYYRAIAHKQIGEKEKAAECLERLYREMPDFSEGVIELIACYFDADKEKEAIGLAKAYKSSKSFDEDHMNSLLLLYPKLSKALEN
ncbi:MAG: hypothetical protein SFU87_11020 [Chitinophagaceae bacterium]|nr:hypothetical protein [Chitinophagaceae bacterium]